MLRYPSACACQDSRARVEFEGTCPSRPLHLVFRRYHLPARCFAWLLAIACVCLLATVRSQQGTIYVNPSIIIAIMSLPEHQTLCSTPICAHGLRVRPASMRPITHLTSHMSHRVTICQLSRDLSLSRPAALARTYLTVQIPMVCQVFLFQETKPAVAFSSRRRHPRPHPSVPLP